MTKKYFYCLYLGSIETQERFLKEQLVQIAPRLVFKLRQFNASVFNSSRQLATSKIVLKLNEHDIQLIRSNRGPTIDTLKYSNIVYVERQIDEEIVSLIVIKSIGRRSLGTNVIKKVLTAEIHSFKCDTLDLAKQLELVIKNSIQLSKKYRKIVINSPRETTGDSHNSTATTITTSDSHKSEQNNTSNNNNNNSKSQHKFIQNVAKEFREKLKQEKPILYPPKDYNTVMRNRGDLKSIDERRSLNPLIVGQQRATNKHIEDIESIDEDAKRALNYYDDMVNSLLPMNDHMNQNNDKSMPIPSFNAYLFTNENKSENIKRNPLLINELKCVSRNLFNRTHNDSQQQQQQQKHEQGFRSGAFKRLGNYAPKCMVSMSSNDASNKHVTKSANNGFLHKKTFDNNTNKSYNLGAAQKKNDYSPRDNLNRQQQRHLLDYNNNDNDLFNSQFIIKKQENSNEVYANRRSFKPIVTLDNDLELYSDVYY